MTSANFGSSVTSNIEIGSTKTTWTVATRTPIIKYETAIINSGAQDDSCGGGVNGSGYGYIAIQITPDASFNAKYIGVSFSGTTSDSIYLYTNSGGSLGDLLVTSQIKSNYFISPIARDAGGSKNSFNGNNQYYLGSSGVSFVSGTNYWVVLKVASWQYNGADDLSVVTSGNPMFSNDGVSWVSQSTCRFHASGLGGGALMPNVWITN